MRRILITGADSYIGLSLEQWLQRFPEQYQIDTLGVRGDTWQDYDFSAYQVVFHVAGIVHRSTGKKQEIWEEYDRINTQLALHVAERAKNAGVEQFIFMSSMSVYGNVERITSDTKPKPESFYGASKWKAEQGLRKLSGPAFKIVLLRPPMVYGKEAKGNYPKLSNIARKTMIFPNVENRRSMIYVENLCEFIKLMIDHEESGTFFPQDKEWMNTSRMVWEIANVWKHTVWFTKALAPAIWLGNHFPGKIGRMCQKAFGNCYYEMDMSEYKEDYRVCGLREAVKRTER